MIFSWPNAISLGRLIVLEIVLLDWLVALQLKMVNPIVSDVYFEHLRTRERVVLCAIPFYYKNQSYLASMKPKLCSKISILVCTATQRARIANLIQKLFLGL